MSVLSDRIRWLHNPQTANSDVVTASYKDYGAIKAIPLARIQIHPGVVAYDEPLITADGAPVSNTGFGSWGQLYAVGRGY
jgi:hypothetical protein